RSGASATLAVESEFDDAAAGFEIEADLLQPLRPPDSAEAELFLGLMHQTGIGAVPDRAWPHGEVARPQSLPRWYVLQDRIDPVGDAQVVIEASSATDQIEVVEKRNRLAVSAMHDDSGQLEVHETADGVGRSCGKVRFADGGDDFGKGRLLRVHLRRPPRDLS